MSSSYFATLSHYNAWANRRLYRACETLSETEYMRERASFFGSLHAVLNHVLVADRIWVARIKGRTPPNLTLEYRDSRGDRLETPLRLVLGHFFNHQAHHRGQAHGMLSQTEVSPPP